MLAVVRATGCLRRMLRPGVGLSFVLLWWGCAPAARPFEDPCGAAPGPLDTITASRAGALLDRSRGLRNYGTAIFEMRRGQSLSDPPAGGPDFTGQLLVEKSGRSRWEFESPRYASTLDGELRFSGTTTDWDTAGKDLYVHLQRKALAFFVDRPRLLDSYRVVGFTAGTWASRVSLQGIEGPATAMCLEIETESALVGMVHIREADGAVNFRFRRWFLGDEELPSQAWDLIPDSNISSPPPWEQPTR